ncbi:MAG TPA: hypothetical protein VKA31_06915 [Mariprofundaceae bacterium]|nr:hypothetical protein [Mariprofundaceae bacterium]
MPKNDSVRANLRLPSDVVRRVDEFASRSCISRTQAVTELLHLGLDGELAGLESCLQIQAQLHRELQSLRGLVVAVMDSSDTACALTLMQMVGSGVIPSAEAANRYRSARQQAMQQIRQLKKADV